MAATDAQRRFALIGVVVLALLGLLIWSLHRDPQAQTKALFDRLQSEIKDHDASGVVGELHPRYDVAAHWGGEAAEEGVADQSNLRDLARRGLALLMMQQGEGMHLDYEIHSIAPQPDGTVLADVELSVGSGAARLLVSPQPSHHFVLAWSGTFWARLKVLSHDPIAVNH